MESVTFTETIGKNEKLCFDCKTSKTPLWRSGPAGPKSLCNACGIRFRKKKSVVGSDKKKEKQHLSTSPVTSMSISPTSSSTDDNTTSSRKREIGEVDVKRKKVRVKVVAVLQRPRSPMKKVKKRIEVNKFGEVEEAAYLLMCLSCG